MRNIAIIGTRNPSKMQAEVCSYLSKRLSPNHTIVTGGADGIDSIAMDNSVSKCLVYLPWPQYRDDRHNYVALDDVDQTIRDEAFEMVSQHHPCKRLKQGAQKLHARNWLIVKASDLVIAFPSKRGGGTAMGIKFAEVLKRPCKVYPIGKSIDGEEIYQEVSDALNI